MVLMPRPGSELRSTGNRWCTVRISAPDASGEGYGMALRVQTRSRPPKECWCSLDVNRCFLKKRPLRLKHVCRTLGFNREKTAETMLELYHNTAQIEVPLLPPLGANWACPISATGHWIWPLQPLPCYHSCRNRFYMTLASNESIAALELGGLHSSSNLGCEMGNPTGKVFQEAGQHEKMAR